VRARFVIIPEILLEKAPKVSVIYNNHVVQALTSDATDQALRVAILPRAFWCDRYFLDTYSFNTQSELLTVDSIAISNHVLWRAVIRKCFDNLLRSPYGSWVLRNVEMEDTSTIMREDDKDIQHA
jgi:hypothetical protein